MILLPPRPTRTDTLFSVTTLFRSQPYLINENNLRSVSIAGLMYPVLAIAEDSLEGHIAKIDCGGICETLYLGMGKGRHAAIVSLVVARADPRYGAVRLAGWR